MVTFHIPHAVVEGNVGEGGGVGFGTGGEMPGIKKLLVALMCQHWNNFNVSPGFALEVLEISTVMQSCV